jgi:anti-anti-sigma factor
MLRSAMPLTLSTAPLQTLGHVIKLEGSLDTNTFGQLEAEITRLTATEPALLVLDLAALAYISSAGIRIVQKGARAMEKIGGQFKLVNPQPQVAKVFEVIKVMPTGQLFSSEAELDAYLAKIQNRPPATPPRP